MMTDILSPIAPPPFAADASVSRETSDRTYRVIPFNAATFPQGEILLPGLWRRLHDEHLFDAFFHDVPDLTFGQFVAAMSSTMDPIQLVCEVGEGPEGPETVLDTAAIGMLTQAMRTPLVRRALGNFLFFRKYWGAESLHVGAALLDAWFTEFEVIAGITPAANHRALNYIRRVGFIVDGSIPDFASYRGETCASIITHQTRREWERNRAIILGLDADSPSDDRHPPEATD